MLKVAYFVSVLCFNAAVEYSRVHEGYPQGLWSHCPGSFKAAVIKPKTLKKLYISVYGENRQHLGSYDYYHMEGLAKNPGIDFKNKTVLWNGGYLDSNVWGTPKTMGVGYKAYGYNVLSLDTLYFTTMYYPLAARLAPTVGKHVAEMLVKLGNYGLDPKKLELVGMSLGAQTMSFVAKNYRKITGKNVSLLTNLDPAGVCFRQLSPSNRVDKSDADFVVSVVTNMDIAGTAYHVSHITFYVNGGEFQPGDIWWIPCDYLCSHFRAIQLWMSAWVYPRGYIGVRCDTVQQAKDGDCFDLKPMVTNRMGPLTDRSKTGHGLDPKKLEITGMSLGAHTMGFAAKHYRLMTSQNISLLVALDGAGPCFRHLGPDQRLDKSDADFVVSVLTTMDLSGISVPYAHVTFYVNGGAFQEGEKAWLPCDTLCSHARSYFVWWVAVVHPRSFIGVRCVTVQQTRDGNCFDLKPMVTNTMGLFTDSSKPGIYYLRTGNRWPYALGRRGLIKSNK